MKGMTAVVTGGASGIGKCIVKMLADNGGKVFFVDNDKTALECAVDELRTAGLDVVGHCGDVADERARSEFAAAVLTASTDGIDLLVNNACISRGG